MDNKELKKALIEMDTVLRDFCAMILICDMSSQGHKPTEKELAGIFED